MARVLFWSQFPTGKSGYGRVVGNLGPRLAKLGHEVAYYAYTHVVELDGLSFQGLPVFTPPFSWQHRRRDYIAEVVKGYQPDVVLQHFDLFSAMPQMKQYVRFPMVSYFPVDGTPLGHDLKECAGMATLVVPMSRFAERVFNEAGVSTTEVIYHGADAQVYKPAEDKAKLRAEMEIPGVDADTFLVLMVSTNARRKNLPSQIKAWSDFKAITGAKTQLLMVINNMGDYAEWSLSNVWQHIGLPHTSFLQLSELPEENLAHVYAAADVLLLCSHSEGFGLPIVEAGACAVPTIGTNFGSITELIEGRGWLVDGEVSYCQPLLYTWQMNPSQHGITKALIDAYQHPEKRAEYGQAMREFVLEKCDWGKIAEQWDRVLRAV